jgi:outer membrane protein
MKKTAIFTFLSVFIFSNYFISYELAAKAEAIYTKLAFFDMEAVIEKSEEYRSEITKIQQESEKHRKRFTELEQKRRKLETKLQNSSGDTDITEEARRNTAVEAANLKANLEIEMQAAQQHLERKLQDLQKRIYTRIKDVAYKIAKQQGWDAVSPALIVINPDIEITDDVIEALNKEYLAEQAAEQKSKPVEKEKKEGAVKKAGAVKAA